LFSDVPAEKCPLFSDVPAAKMSAFSGVPADKNVRFFLAFRRHKCLTSHF
jgi:hypothetical protein